MDKLYITDMQIEEVRHLKDIYIPLSKDKMKHLIFTGRNGSGKTSVLEAITQYFNSEEIILGNNNHLDALDVMKIFDRIEKKDGRKEQSDYEMHKRLREYYKRIVTKDSGVTLHFNCEKEKWKDLSDAGNYVVAYYGADRVFQSDIPKHVEKVELKDSYGITESPRKEFVKYLLDLKMTEALAVSKGNVVKSDEIKNWFVKLEALMQKVFEDSELKLVFDEDNFQFHIYETGHNPFDFNTLSSGYAAVMDIIVDLIMRMEKHSDKKFQFLMSGIVFIDEIETHLHLELQRNILGLLTTIFPNIQFVVSTHSPFILNSLENAVIYDLENRILVENGLANVPYDGIVEGYFKADAMSQLLKEKYERYKVLVKKEKLTDEDFEELARLELFLNEIPDYLALGITTEYQRLKLEFAGREDV